MKAYIFKNLFLTNFISEFSCNGKHQYLSITIPIHCIYKISASGTLRAKKIWRPISASVIENLRLRIPITLCAILFVFAYIGSSSTLIAAISCLGYWGLSMSPNSI